MKYRLGRFALVLIAGLALLAVVAAQDRSDREAVAAAAGNLYVVSAKAGGVNFVSGNVTIMREDGTNGPLVKGAFVEVGDVVSTGDNGRAEILMNPGSFIRLDHNSKFYFESTSLSDLRVFVAGGTAIFEVFASDDFKVAVDASGSRFYLTKSGVYRIDVDPSGDARLEVWKGKAQAGDTEATQIKKGRAASIDGDTVAINKFNGNMDDFEEWSKSRAKEIAKANRKLIAKRLGPTVLSSFRGYGWDCFSSVGLWVFNRRYGQYSFLPFGAGWRSPYGYRLGTNTELCYYPSYYWRPPIYRRHNGGGGNGDTGDGGGGGGGTTGGRIGPPGSFERPPGFDPTPPFQRMQQSGSVRRTTTMGGGRGFDGGGFPGGSNGRGTRPVQRSNGPSKTAPRSSPPVSAPRRTDSKVKVN